MFGKSLTNPKKVKSLIVPEKVETGTLLLWNDFLFHVRVFGCGQNQLLSTFGKDAYSAQNVCEADRKKLVAVIVGLFSLREKAPTKKRLLIPSVCSNQVQK